MAVVTGPDGARAMSFQPHPAQVQALRTAKRFREGFRPTMVHGKPLPPTTIPGKIIFN